MQFEEVKKRLRDRHAELKRELEELTAKLSVIEQAEKIADEYDHPERRRSKAGELIGLINDISEFSQETAVLKIMRTLSQKSSAKQIASALANAGYKFRTDDPANSIGVLLNRLSGEGKVIKEKDDRLSFYSLPS